MDRGFLGVCLGDGWNDLGFTALMGDPKSEKPSTPASLDRPKRPFSIPVWLNDETNPSFRLLPDRVGAADQSTCDKPRPHAGAPASALTIVALRAAKNGRGFMRRSGASLFEMGAKGRHEINQFRGDESADHIRRWRWPGKGRQS
jgi:hypothetical protein